LHQLIGLALLMQGRFRQVVQVGRAIESEAASAGPGPRVYAHHVLGWGYKGQGLVPQAIEQFEQAVSEGKQGADKNDLAVAYENLGLQNFLGGRFVAARESLAQSLALFRESANELRGVNALHTLCRVWAAEGDHLRASQQILQALDLENGDAGRLAADAHHVLGAIQVLHAEWDNARSSFEQALRIRKKSGHKMGIVEATVALGFVDQCLGRWDNALATYLQALDVAEEMDPSPQQVLARRSLGLLRLLAGDGAAAATELQQALALAETMPETLEYAPTLLAMAELRLQAEQLEPALIFARQSLDAARPLEHVAEANIVLASIHLARGDVEAAQQYAAAATLHATRLAAPRLLARACLATAQVERLLKADTATASFQLALRHAEAAGTPVERAAVRRAFADHLRAGGSDWDVAQSMEAEAETLVRTLTDSPTRRPGFHPCNR
jgi:tetratricopeptide (TPR) repeat protein